MKTTNCKIKSMILIVLMAAGACTIAQAQKKQTAAVLGIDSKGVIQDAEAVGFMVRLELEKTNFYTVIDKYDVAEAVKQNNIDLKTCFGKSCVVAAGKILRTDKMVTGSVERFGEKIVISLKVVDVATEAIEKQDATEYLNLQPELQRMIGISVQKLLGVAPNQNIVNLLINYDTPIVSPKTQLSLNGPRMGFSIASGDAADVLSAAESQGGYNMYPITFQFGWQKEWQYLSAGDFQALVELFPMIGGLESGKFIPSLTFLNGFRMGKRGWEFAFGPSFRLVKKAEGFWGDGKNGTTDRQWYLSKEWNAFDPSTQNPYLTVKRLDSRGVIALSTSLFFGVGRTFKSGYLNIPVNLYVLPRKEGTIVGMSFGFNLYSKPKVY